MPDTASRSRYFMDIEPELRNRLKAFAALRGKTMKEWLTEAIIAKLEDEIDISESLSDMANDEDAIPLEDFLKARKKLVQDKNKASGATRLGKATGVRFSGDTSGAR